MQRLPLVLLALIVLAAAGAAYWQREALMGYYEHWRAPAATEPEPEAGPHFSRLPPPDPGGARLHSPPGTFYVLKRQRVINRAGVQAVNPGEQVRLLERLPGGKLRVTIDNKDFTLPASEVTDDLERAREAEKQFFDSPSKNL